MAKITFLPSNIQVEAKPGRSLLDMALDAGVSIQHACGGFCACTTCHCEVVSGSESLAEAEEDELDRLEMLDKTPASRLACQSKVRGTADVVVQVVNTD
jgi:ferredoxin, 2Fe-2S